MIKELKQLIYHCAYEDAAKICEPLDYEQLRHEIGWMGFEEVSMVSFGFIEYMIIKTEKTKWIELMDYMGFLFFADFGGETYSKYCARELLKEIEV